MKLRTVWTNRFLFAALVILPVCCFARDFVAQGRRFVDARIESISGDLVTIEHSGGTTNLHRGVVPKELFEDYNSAQKRLSFKGLRLGMTAAQVDDLTKTTLWGYKFSSSRVDFSKPDQQVFLTPDLNLDHKKPGDGNSFGSIGHAGRPGAEINYNWNYAYVHFHEGRVYKIDVSSFSYAADKIDSYVLSWLGAAKQGLTEKYGEPRKIYIPTTDISIRHFHTGFTVPVCDWVLDNQRVVLGLLESQAEFGVSITYSDVTVDSTLKTQDKVKTDL